MIVLAFNATLTAKVIQRRSVTQICFLAFLHQYEYNFLSKATDYFSHMLQEAKIRRTECLLNRITGLLPDRKRLPKQKRFSSGQLVLNVHVESNRYLLFADALCSLFLQDGTNIKSYLVIVVKLNMRFLTCKISIYMQASICD